MLPSNEAESLTRKVAASLPRLILYIVAGAPSHIGHLKQRVQKWYPGNEPIGAPVEELVEAYVERGDLERGKGGIIRCLPPYVVSAPGMPVMDLYGNPAIEATLCRMLESPDAVVYLMEGTDPIRRIQASLDKVTPDLLTEAQVTCLSSEDVIARIPDIAAMSMPNPQDCTSLTMTGRWEFYDPIGSPASYQTGRWSTFNETVEGGKLIRQVPSESSPGSWHQYYLYAGVGRAKNINDDEARLWQFAIDRRTGRPIPWNYSSETGLEINGWLPAPCVVALRALSGRPARRDRYRRWFPLPLTAKPVLEAMTARLGTSVV